jgi:hypothetical protein
MRVPCCRPRAAVPLLHRLIAVGGIALVLLLTVLAVSPRLHAWLHGQTGEADHECAVTLFQQGVMPTAVGIILAAAVLLFLSRIAALPAELHLVPPPNWLHPGRAPPGR